VSARTRQLRHDLSEPDLVVACERTSSSCQTSGQPTSALPGSLEKMMVMSQRYDRGEPLFHPDDPVVEHAPLAWTLGIYVCRIDL
jgi:hypothetical protein